MTEKKAETTPQDQAATAEANAKEKAAAKTDKPAVAQERQAPSVGRIVHFHDERRFKDQPVAGLITQVHTDKTVNLTLFLLDGKVDSKQGVAQAPKSGPVNNTWSWPPRN